jgi:hypothetical protein
MLYGDGVEPYGFSFFTEVKISPTDIPSEVEAPRHESPRNPNQDPMWIRSFTIQFRNGLEIRHQNISYSSLASLVKKMEGLC